MEWGERSISGNMEKALFLRAVAQVKDREFFGDVWLKLLYADDLRQFTGCCSRVITSSLENIAREIVRDLEQGACDN